MERLEADEHLNTACQAISASVAMLRATELHLHEIQDRQGFSLEEAAALCEQVLALRDLLRLRLAEMNSGAKLDGPISRGPSPSRVKAGSRVAWVAEPPRGTGRGGSVPPTRASADFTTPKKGDPPTGPLRRGTVVAVPSLPNLSSLQLPQLSRGASAAQDEAEGEVPPLLEATSPW